MDLVYMCTTCVCVCAQTISFILIMLFTMKQNKWNELTQMFDLRLACPQSINTNIVCVCEISKRSKSTKKCQSMMIENNE